MEQRRSRGARPRPLSDCGVALALAIVSLGGLAGAEAITRSDFPEGFVFGAGTSAYQYLFVLQGYAFDHATGDVAADQYHKYKACFSTLEDVKLMHEMGLDAYRFSIAWTRLISDGRGAVNPKGLEYYNNLIDELVSYGIQPHVTIYHFDLPQALQDEYNGLLSTRFIEDFTAYADVCFRNFGDRVKHWTTLNEPNIEPLGGYDLGNLPPRRCSAPFGKSCAGGNSTTEPYIVAHNLLLAHASAVSLYKDKYQDKQGGQIGITLLAFWYEPATQKLDDVEAATRMSDFTVGWFMHPLVYGHYPPVMKRNAGSRLPLLTPEESARVLGSFDFVGINHYGAVYVASDMGRLKQIPRDYVSDAAVKFITLPFQSSKDKFTWKSYMMLIFKQGGLRMQNHPAPWALNKLLDHLKHKYRNPPIVIYENGAGHEPDPSDRFVYDDDFRSHFLQAYIEATLLSIRNGSRVHGYFVWSFMDVFEVLFGYRFLFGLYGIDFGAKNRTRYARHSVRWYAGFLHGGELRPAAVRAGSGAYSA
nr:unnamed protein product [Digitaria exilis]